MPVLHCCEWFRIMIASAGEQGHAVIAFRDDDYRVFHLQARALTKEQMRLWEEALRRPETPMAELFATDDGGLVPIVAVQRVPILYCPHCGTDLHALIEANIEQFDRLAEVQRQFATD